MKRVMIAGTNSACGKTTTVCAILNALAAKGLMPTAFKCGPDYTDPIIHRAEANVHSYNLDPYFLDGEGLRAHLAELGGEIAVIEGAMGYYDGIAATSESSAYTVARETGTPVVLLVNAKASGASLGAVIEGFARHRSDSGIAGVIFNFANGARYPDLRRIAESAGVRPYGYMREGLDIDGLLALANTAPPLVPPPLRGKRPRRVRLAVARDEAFCYLYEENLLILEKLGCELIFFSPSREGLPPEVNGLYLCGGEPCGQAVHKDIKAAVEAGLPTIAEGAGFAALYPCFATERLIRFGYITMTANRDNMLCKAGEAIRSHTYCRLDCDDPGNGFTAKKAGCSLEYACAHISESLYAGFPQLYFPANPAFAENFVKRMAMYEA